MYSEWEGTPWGGSVPEVRTEPESGSVLDFLQRMTGARSSPWRLPSIREALGVPSIQRAVTLISNTTGALTVQAFRNSAVMDRTPAVVARPDPYSTPRDFYRDSSYNMATRGECVWWIASRDIDDIATALIVVPLAELSIEPNNDNRLFPTYRWGKRVSTRYSPANPKGEFVHITYLKEPGDLRGQGPLQLGMAAASVSVEAQEWAANFYADGGNPSLLIKHGGILGPERTDDTGQPDDENGLNEAERLRAQWMDKPHNVPRVIDQTIEDVKYLQPNEGSAQGLQSRDFQTGESARLFGIPGALLEYGVAGASLTYQNLADVWLNFVRGCLAPNYLEPIEQAMTDLLPRSTVTRFLTSGLYRADPEARWRIYQIAVAVLGQEEAAAMARVNEDLAPGNPETAPVAFAPPSAIPSALPQVRTGELELRCDGMRVRRQHGIASMERCGKLLSTTGTFVGMCPRCKKEHTAAA